MLIGASIVTPALPSTSSVSGSLYRYGEYSRYEPGRDPTCVVTVRSSTYRLPYSSSLYGGLVGGCGRQQGLPETAPSLDTSKGELCRSSQA